MKLLVLLGILTSCSLFKTYTVDRDLSKSTEKICLTSYGKGRLTVKNQKYIFSYESALDPELATWVLAMDFPLRKTETFTIDWSAKNKIRFDSTIADKILRENSGVNPVSVERFTTGLGKLLQEIIFLRSSKSLITESKNKLFKWKTSNKKLQVHHNNWPFNAVFKNLEANSHFGLMSVEYRDTDKQLYKLDLIVRKCLD
ncbi:MAG: hypothetical protein HON90_01115 [Halobacteriovoraceae bacterium]|jgi:hypothetical protein|nr:hypothetical protein [Halobacteriovoraceae bacterium]